MIYGYKHSLFLYFSKYPQGIINILNNNKLCNIMVKNNFGVYRNHSSNSLKERNQKPSV